MGVGAHLYMYDVVKSSRSLSHLLMSFLFTDWMLFLTPDQQYQSTEWMALVITKLENWTIKFVDVVTENMT